MEIEVESPMRLRAMDSAQEYRPILAGQKLKVEDGTAANSDHNLKTLISSGLRVTAIHVERGTPVFVFSTGATYLALGMSVGQGARDPKTITLARAIGKAFGGKTEEWIPVVSEHWPSNYSGPIVSTDRPSASRPRLFEAE
jgi:hypothetical protein